MKVTRYDYSNVYDIQELKQKDQKARKQTRNYGIAAAGIGLAKTVLPKSPLFGSLLTTLLGFFALGKAFDGILKRSGIAKQAKNLDVNLKDVPITKETEAIETKEIANA